MRHSIGSNDPVTLATSIVLFLPILVGLLGCSAYQRTEPVPKTFLEDVDTTKRIKNLPFQHAWVKPGFDGSKFHKIYLAPIRTDLLPIEQWERSYSQALSTKAEYLEAVHEIRNYFASQLREEFSNYPDTRIVIVTKPSADVLTLQLAFTEIEFSHPIARAASLAAPIPGTGAMLGAISDPHAAFAARILNPSGQLVATAADRKFPPTRIIDLNKLTVRSSVREICALWAKMIVESINKGQFKKVSGEGAFSLMPW